ncbi:MAG: SDR family oxidoreductase [Salinivirgaceae bacterium]|jgi:uncharacterized protein YbjT (DUF2867 family)|nr:SDR family oxidoreductase [Salinivirgaceae bacterium]
MHILLTGATGYIGKRLLIVLLNQGHEVTCCVRNPQRFSVPDGYEDKVHVLKYDFSKDFSEPLTKKPIDAAYYLIHSLSTATGGYKASEQLTANNFVKLAEQLKCKQVIYLGGIANENKLSEHLSSRQGVEEILKAGNYNTTILRAAIIVGSGSSSFEIIRDLVEKLPIMIAPKWVNTKCQPIAINNVIEYLTGVLNNPKTFNKTFDIGGPEVFTYKQMMLLFGKARGLKRYIFTIPIMTPRLSSYWLYFITATNYKLAVNLVNSMKIEVVCKNDDLQQILQLNLINYEEAIKRAFDKIEQNMVLSSWKDALSSSNNIDDWNMHINVPSNGCFTDDKLLTIKASKEKVQKKIWSIGGKNGWYYATFLWKIRGFIDKIFGGVGLRRGRTNVDSIKPGDALDFWRVLVADEKNSRLLLYAEMRLPGEAWLEFTIDLVKGVHVLKQKATFRPLGLSGRLYWFLSSPFHYFIFNGMANKIAKG